MAPAEIAAHQTAISDYDKKELECPKIGTDANRKAK
jgi:hypothetical protein